MVDAGASGHLRGELRGVRRSMSSFTPSVMLGRQSRGLAAQHRFRPMKGTQPARALSARGSSTHGPLHATGIRLTSVSLWSQQPRFVTTRTRSAASSPPRRDPPRQAMTTGTRSAAPSPPLPTPPDPTKPTRPERALMVISAPPGDHQGALSPLLRPPGPARTHAAAPRYPAHPHNNAITTTGRKSA